MSRSSAITVGFLLLFTGVQLSMVESYVLTPRASKFWAEKMESSDGVFQTVYNNQYPTPNGGSLIPGQPVLPQQSRTNPQSVFANNAYQSGYGGAPTQNAAYRSGYNNVLPAAGFVRGVNYPPKRIIPPQWLCWPAICLGAVMFLYGAAFKRS